MELAEIIFRLTPFEKTMLQAALFFGHLDTVGTDINALLRECPEIKELREKWWAGERNEVERLAIRRRLSEMLGENRQNKDWDAIAPKSACPPDRSYERWAVERWDERHAPGMPDAGKNVLYGRGAHVAAAAYCFAAE